MSQTINRKELFKQIVKERRSIRNYDTNVKITHEELEEMLTLATRAPSSTNLQPWKFIIIDSAEGKDKLLPLAGFNSTQVTTSSAVVAVFADIESVENLEEIYSKSVELGIMPQEVKERQVEQISAGYKTISREQKLEAALIDNGLVSMLFMLTAKAYGYDTNPIGGYDRDNIAQTFGLNKDRYLPVMIISVGKAVEEGYPSYRLPVSSVAEWH
ncbi:nitroreductase family protein [Alkalicoccobacillus murimartini]|uniref:Nitroreductase n=1 Tax=Alkalicoccobacillus murimartini TaxID=171685 RepID=A0ABT9YLV3_9BACI|nr:nitroreductase family protein [Alkalicoccobacillus murimartini]MDQ0208573.1 nitroreductase [Alkalicoccobacillus murimartini]